MKKNKNITITINENENKSETIYNNVITNMDKLSLNKDEQIEYLKLRITDLETKEKKGFQIIIAGLLLLIILLLGIILIIKDIYSLGIITILIAFILSIYTTYKLSNETYEKSNKFEEIETIRKIISSKLK